LLENHLKNSQTKNTLLINNILLWRLNTWSYIFINTVEHHHSLDLVLSSNFTMSKRLSIEERFKEFRNRFSQTSETDSSKFSSAESFINEDDKSFAETVISSVSIENWKTRCMILDRETNWLNELSKQRDDEIKELKTRLQIKEIMRSCKDLKDKQLELYQITVKAKIFYHLRLSISMKHLHSMFSSKLLQLYSEDSLSKQHAESLRLIIIDDDDDEHWKIDDILNFRRYRGQIQYKVKWKDLDRDDEWYYVNKDEFNDFKKVLNEFHTLYSRKSR